MTTYATTPVGAASAAQPLTAPRPRPRPAARGWNIAATTVIWLTSLFVVALWVSGGGLQALVGMNGETLTTLGRITGLVSANLLLYQVLLMARIPLFERGFGRDGITRMHRLVGFWSFWLMAAHIALIAVGYAVTAQVDVLAELWTLVVDYPGMLLATAGTLLLVLVVVTSIRRSRQRLRYESWHLLHLYAYLGVGLALPHQLWTGADFLSSPAATAYWWTLWAAAAASVIVFRRGAPPRPVVATRPAGRERHARRNGRGRGAGRGQEPPPPQCAPGAVLRLAVHGRSRLDEGQPVLAGSRAARRRARDRGPRGRGRHPPAALAATGHAGPRGGPVRHHDRRRPHPQQDALHRGGGRNRPAHRDRRRRVVRPG